MSKLGRANLFSERNARIYTNANEEISAIDENEVMQNHEDSHFNLTEDDSKDVIYDNNAYKETSTHHEINRLKGLNGSYNLFYIDVVSVEQGSTDTNADFNGSNYSGANAVDVLVAGAPAVNLTYGSILSKFGVDINSSNFELLATWSLTNDSNSVRTSFNPISSSYTTIGDTSSRLYTYRTVSGSPSTYYLRYTFRVTGNDYYEVNYI